jgi:hypothetical protein
MFESKSAMGSVEIDAPAQEPLHSSPHTLSKAQTEHALLQQAIAWLSELLGIELSAVATQDLFSDCWLL